MRPLDQLLRQWSARLAAAGVATPAADARWLAAHVLRQPPATLALHPEIGTDQEAEIDALVRRRERREPLQHILGSAPFLDLDLAVGPGVFVPRPETEVLADYVIRWLLELPNRGAGVQIVDFCAGSGALALAIACHVPRARVTAVDSSRTALTYAERNLKTVSGRLAVIGSSVDLIAADVSRPWTGLTAATVDAVVCNPPYIPDDAEPRDPEVRDHDPAQALYGGPDGMAVVRPIVASAARLLRPGGLFAVEHGDDQGGPDGVPGLVGRTEVDTGARAFEDVADHQDLAGRPRFTTATRR